MEFKFQPRGQGHGIRNGLGKIAESVRHLPRIAQVALVIYCEQAASLFQVSMVTDRSKYIENFSVICRGITNTVGSQQRQAQALGNTDGGLVAPFFLTLVMALNFYIDILSSEDSNQLFGNFNGCRFPPMHECRCHWAFISAGQADQS